MAKSTQGPSKSSVLRTLMKQFPKATPADLCAKAEKKLGLEEGEVNPQLLYNLRSGKKNPKKKTPKKKTTKKKTPKKKTAKKKATKKKTTKKTTKKAKRKTTKKAKRKTVKGKRGGRRSKVPGEFGILMSAKNFIGEGDVNTAMDSLSAASNFIEEAGGIDAAQAAISTVGKLQK